VGILDNIDNKNFIRRSGISSRAIRYNRMTSAPINPPITNVAIPIDEHLVAQCPRHHV
jgi:hypothetical protein